MSNKIWFDRFEDQLATVPIYPDPRRRKAMWEAHVKGNTIDGGSILEFGVYAGGSIGWFTSHYNNTPCYGFDSFEGLPEDWKLGKLVLKAGHFSTKGLTPTYDVNGVRPTYIKGWFEDTVEPFLEEFDDYVKILHLDADIYSATKLVFDNIYPYLRVGTFILFDEITQVSPNHDQYDDMRQHEYKAFKEFCEANPNFDFEVIARTTGPQVMIKVIAL